MMLTCPCAPFENAQIGATLLPVASFTGPKSRYSTCCPRKKPSVACCSKWRIGGSAADAATAKAAAAASATSTARMVVPPRWWVIPRQTLGRGSCGAIAPDLRDGELTRSQALSEHNPSVTTVLVVD